MFAGRTGKRALRCRHLHPAIRLGAGRAHFHTCVIDGVFSQDAAGDLQFHPATALSQTDVVAVQTLVRRRVLSLFERKGLLTPEAAENMRRWQHGGGFSFDASVVIDASDRAGLERLLRYCARPAFSVERLSWCLPTAT